MKLALGEFAANVLINQLTWYMRTSQFSFWFFQLLVAYIPFFNESLSSVLKQHQKVVNIKEKLEKKLKKKTILISTGYIPALQIPNKYSFFLYKP
jgi:hypothetical protein